MEEEIKRRMKDQVQEQFMHQHAQEKKAEEILKTIKMQILDRDARERLNNLRIVKPDIALQIELYLAQLYQAGQIKNKITDKQIVGMLQKLQTKKEFKIRKV